MIEFYVIHAQSQKQCLRTDHLLVGRYHVKGQGFILHVLTGSGGLATLDFKTSEICLPEELLAFQRHAVQSRAHSSGEQVFDPTPYSKHNKFQASGLRPALSCADSSISGARGPTIQSSIASHWLQVFSAPSISAS